MKKIKKLPASLIPVPKPEAVPTVQPADFTLTFSSPGKTTIVRVPNSNIHKMADMFYQLLLKHDVACSKEEK